MKNYVVITTLDEDMNVFATFHKTSDMDVLTKLGFAGNLSTATLWDGTSPMAYGTLYYIESDNESELEPVMRTLGFRRCDVCGAWVTPQDKRTGASTWDGRIRLCPTCLAREEQSANNSKRITLGSYHSTRSFKVWNEDGTLSDILADGQYLGIEMEVNGRDVSIRNRQFKATDEFYAIANPRSRKQVFHCEEDCTVKAEFISNCFTKNSFRAFNWDILTEQTKKMGNDEKYPTVGFHIHLSKTLLGTDEREQALNFLKLQYVLNKYESDFFKVSGRNSRSEMSYCGFWSLDQIENLKNRVLASNSDAWYCMPSSHSYALISSGRTIELRICHSTNDSERIRHTLELVWNLVENIKNVRWEKLWCLGKLFKLVPSETMNYWRNKGAFLNTMAADTRGMSIQASC